MTNIYFNFEGLYEIWGESVMLRRGRDQPFSELKFNKGGLSEKTKRDRLKVH